jgi:hypothetical protein
MTSGALGTTDDGRFEMDVDVRLMDASGPIVGEAVSFAVTKGKGTLGATRVLTDAEGYARTTIRFGLADENVIESWTATEARAVTTVMAYCAVAPEQTTLPCPAGD